MTARRLLPFIMLSLVAAAGMVSACDDEETVFVDREPFNPPPDEGSGMLGYYTASEQLTTCGNCHVGTHSQWRDLSAHSGAFSALVNAGQDDNEACWACHTVSENGNPADAPAGMTAVADEAYHDVQCENCHGQGFDHVQLPDDRTTWPLARADVTVDPGTGRALDTDASCASCHGAAHGSSLAGDWLKSRHANINTSPAGNPSCVGCHNGKFIIRRYTGQESNYVERDSLTGQYQYLPITCTACHDPHGSPNPSMLRLPIDVPDLQSNLCMSCHNRGTEPAASFSNGDRGPHASQGPILIGTGAGYTPGGFAFDTVQAYSTHASGANPRLCAGCHVNSFEATSDGVTIEYSGHQFLPIPCVDGAGAISEDQDCGYTTAERNWQSCVDVGCHGDATVAFTLFTTERQAVQALIDEIWVNNDGVGPGGRPIVSAGDGGHLATILATDPTQFRKEAGTEADPYVLTPAEGALFNAQMLAEDLYDHNDGSKGVHNPFYYEALLAATISELEDTYPFLPSVRNDPHIRQLIDRALRRPGFRYVHPDGRVASR